MLWRDLKAFQVYGANTNVGKTILSTLLCKALQRRAPPTGVLYLKPVSTGPAEEADDRHVSKFAPGVLSKCVSQFQDPVSPHLAARLQKQDGTLRTDQSIVAKVKHWIADHAKTGGRYAVLETAGGILSPGPSGSLQADLYRPLRLPIVLVGDSKLGGIATTISAFESLHLRGYDLDSVVVFDDPKWGNGEYLQEHFARHDIATFALQMPPPKQENAQEDEVAMIEYYEQACTSPSVTKMVDLLHDKHFMRVSKLSSMPSHTESIIWHPFRQHGLPQDIVSIDSAYGDHFETYSPKSDPSLLTQPEIPGLQPAAPAASSEPLLTPLFDGSASWWTQGLGHGNPDLALTAAHAAGRYGHVMFANAVHEPALDLSYNLLETLGNPRLSRVFFTDNGSTGMEVAVKMALRASCVRYGWSKDDGKGELGILGLTGSYHGDTIGVMNCAEPNVYNESVDWYKPWGYWFDPPHIKLRKGRWEITRPASTTGGTEEVVTSYETLKDLFDFPGRQEDLKTYEQSIKATLTRLVHEEGRRFGALIMEPVIMGAGGMIFVDPLFQRTLIKVIRGNPSLISTSVDHSASSQDSRTWSGLPVIADEVFTGLYRLGRGSSSSFLSSPTANSTVSPDIAPDISVHAKLLTGGLLPLALTTASESIFNTFVSDRKQDALLHGHSYTAHAVGCAVANKSLATMRRMSGAGTTSSTSTWSAYQDAWTAANKVTSSNGSEPAKSPTFSFFTPQFLNNLSHHPRISGCFALGTVLAMTLASSTTGYTSTAATTLQAALLTQLDEEGAGVHSRVLGDVLYLMTSLTTTPGTVARLERAVMKALG